MNNPKKSRTQTTSCLVEQFRGKGYSCRELREEDATVIFFTHEKRLSLHYEITHAINETFKKLINKN